MLKVVDYIKDQVKEVDSDNIEGLKRVAGAEKIYERKEYIILRVKRGYIVYNTKKNFENGHTHIQSFEMSKTIIDNVLRRKRPKTNSLYLIESHIRVTKDIKYKKVLEEILEAKRNKTKDRKYNNKRYSNAC